MSREKEIFVFEKMLENNENETKETRHFVERDRNRRKNGKNKTSMKPTYFFRKKRNEHKKVKNKEIHKKEKEKKKDD